MVQVPVDPADGGTMRDQARLARIRLLEKPFSAFESEIRDQLQRMLGRVALMRRATSRRSRSIAGRMAIPPITSR